MKQKLLKIPVLGKLLRGGSALIHAGSRFDALFRRVEQCEAQLRDMRDKLAQMENVETWYLKRVVQRLCGDHSGLEELNQALLLQYEKWEELNG